MSQLDQYLAKYSKETTKEYIKQCIQEDGVDFEAHILEAHTVTLKEAAHKKPHYIAKNWMAETFYGNVIGVLKDKHSSRMKVDKKGRDYFALKDDVRLYFKQLDSKYRPNNVETDAIKLLWAENRLLVTEKTHVLFVGYVLKMRGDYSQLKGVFGSYPHDFLERKLYWTISMTEFSKSIKLPKQDNLSDGLFVIAKKKEKNQGTN